MRTVKSTKNVLYKFPEISVRIRSNLNQIKPVFIRSKEIFSNEITLKSLFLIFCNFRNFHNLDKNVLESEFTIFCRFPPNLPKKNYTSYHLSNRIILYGFQENGMYCEILTSSNKKYFILTQVWEVMKVQLKLWGVMLPRWPNQVLTLVTLRYFTSGGSPPLAPVTLRRGIHHWNRTLRLTVKSLKFEKHNLYHLWWLFHRIIDVEYFSIHIKFLSIRILKFSLPPMASFMVITF